MKVVICFLPLLPFTFGATSFSSSSKKLDVMTLIQRIPRSLVLENERRRNLAFDLNELSTWMEKDSFRDCDYEAAIEDEQEQIHLACVMAIDGRMYELVEDCKQPDYDDPSMTCDICVSSSDGEFNFCYSIGCDYSLIFKGGTMDLSDEDAAKELYSSCRCIYATLGGKRCDACELCSSKRTSVKEGLSAHVGRLADLSLTCPNSNLITPACESQEDSQVFETESKPSLPAEEIIITTPSDASRVPSGSGATMTTSGPPNNEKMNREEDDNDSNNSQRESKHPVTSSGMNSLANTTPENSSNEEGLGSWGKFFMVVFVGCFVGTVGYRLLRRSRRIETPIVFNAERNLEETIGFEDSPSQTNNIQVGYID